MKVVAIVQARMNSTRLPGKVLLSVLGKPLLGYLIERLQRSQAAHEVVIATSENPTDDALAEFCHDAQVICFRGSEENVLERYYHSAKAAQADVVVRVCSDCPLLDPLELDGLITGFLSGTGGYDYASNTHLPLGMGAEIFTMTALETAWKHAIQPEEKEHVTPYLYRHPDRFRIQPREDMRPRPPYRLTLDTAEDFALLQHILEALYPENPQFSYADICRLLEAHPEWLALNAHVAQKKL